FSVVPPPPRSSLFPYTTLFRSRANWTATAASMALPPRASISLPTLVAAGYALTTISEEATTPVGAAVCFTVVQPVIHRPINRIKFTGIANGERGFEFIDTGIVKTDN